MRGLLILAVAALGFCTAACASAGWPAPIDDFKTNVDKTVGVVSDYYSALNEYERHILSRDRVLRSVARDRCGGRVWRGHAAGGPRLQRRGDSRAYRCAGAGRRLRATPCRSRRIEGRG